MQLTSEDRRFFAGVADIIFTNPFDDARPAIADLVPGSERAAPAPRGHPFAALAPPLEERLAGLATRGVERLEHLTGADRQLLEYALLFATYSRFAAQFDRLIRAQLARGGEPVEVPFADALLAELHARGFAPEAALRHLALFFQLRRAYFFIDEGLVGASPSMRRLRHALWNNVFTADVRLYGNHLRDRMEDFSTLLLGETGTGKGSAAAAIGRSGLIPFDPARRRFAVSFTTTFTATNLSQFSENLVESELFGHRKGAFTGAIDNHPGLLERVSAHGSLFLDEIGEVSAPIQIKLLNVLQERRFSPVGSHEQRRFAGRVIAATNRPLAELREGGRFREDFFYRLCSDLIEVPPLRRRLRESPAELEQLVALLVERTTGDADPDLAQRVVDALHGGLPSDYAWPGNVRELEQAVRRVLLCASYTAVPARPADPAAALARDLAEGRLQASELLGRYCRMLHERYGSYEEVARRVALDRRTVKKHVLGS